MNLFEVVKASINTQEAAQTYGIDVNHHGMALWLICFPILVFQFRVLFVDH